MSAEGDNNLDNDGAADLLIEISEDLTNRILELLVHPRAHEYDDQEICELFVKIEMLFALHDRRMLFVAPDPAKLRELVDPYVARWEAYHLAAGHEPPIARRASMIATFQELYRVSIQRMQERIVWVPIEPDLESMTSEERAHHETMMRGVPPIGCTSEK